MWLFTPQGFFSISQPRDEPSRVQVRARKEAHIRALAEHIRDDVVADSVVVEVNPKRDYKYRLHMPKDVFANWMSTYVEKLDYDNFKMTTLHRAREKNENDDYCDLLHDIWHLGFKYLGENWKEYNDG